MAIRGVIGRWQHGMVGLDVNLMFHYQESECSCVAYPVSLLLFVPACVSSVSDSCFCPFSRLCLPLCDSFPFAIFPLTIWDAGTPPIPGLPIFVVLKAHTILGTVFRASIAYPIVYVNENQSKNAGPTLRPDIFTHISIPIISSVFAGPKVYQVAIER